jgi:hypothetical protein
VNDYFGMQGRGTLKEEAPMDRFIHEQNLMHFANL